MGNSSTVNNFLKGEHAVCKTLIIVVFVMFLTPLVRANTFATSPNGEGWNKLIHNKPLEAQQFFRKNCRHENPEIAAGAHRGLAYTMKFLGHNDSAMINLFKSYHSDTDSLRFLAAWINMLSFGRDWIGHSVKDGYRVLKILSQNTTFLTSEIVSLLAERYKNDGTIHKAKKLIKKLGIVRSFQMIGPFDNISGSGYKKAYPVEQDIGLTKHYQGKDGSRITWFPFYNKNINGWVFSEFNYASQNAILYYYSRIHSNINQKVNVGFGASGAFKVFLNDNLILADSVFRNTGTDTYIQTVTLKKGDNKLLIKIGHETKYSNFIIRFMDDFGKAIPTLSYSNTPCSEYPKDNYTYTDLTHSPFREKIERLLLEKLKKNPEDHESAILLMDFYNGSELTDKGQSFARNYLARYPHSSLWYDLYSESLQRSNKKTENQTALNTAYKYCQLNYHGWYNELQTLSAMARSRDVMDFINTSPTLFQHTPQALLYKYSHFSQSENELEALKIIDQLQQNYFHIDMIVRLVANLLIERGSTGVAEKLLKKYLRYEKTSTDVYSLLAEIYLKKGDKNRAMQTYLESLRYNPNSPGLYYYLAKFSFQYKEYETALEYIKNAITLSPTSSAMITLKGTILNALGRKDAAIKAFKESIQYTYNDFNAWDQLLPLQGKPDLTKLTTIPDPASLRDSAKNWQGINNEKGAILAFTKDIFLYPSRCSRERHCIAVHLGTQNAIDTWKEYTLRFNDYYQFVNISKAYALNPENKETPADISGSMVVFKTLQPGDVIVLEWTIENYYQHDMAQHLWGDHDFNMPYPVYKTELRFITQAQDTIPYTILGKSITTKKSTVNDFQITTFSRGPYINPPQESYALIDPPDNEKIFYSTFQSWSDIANWYANITENKIQQTYELKSLVDSLTQGIESPEKKVAKIHEYITSAIRYSFVPFRQSAWIPQSAKDVLATKIGDCKDMASLGKSLLDYAGIKNNLVLVNTKDRNSIYPTYIGPNFNHCILSYTDNNQTNYIDLTDNTIFFQKLPRMDQGALALSIQKNNNNLIHLPKDSSSERYIFRTIQSQLDTNGTMVRTVTTVKNGIFASAMRNGYRYASVAEQKKRLQHILVKPFPNVSIDSLGFNNLANLTDTLQYSYSFTAKNAAQFSSNTALLALNIPDKIKGSDFPSEEHRSYPIDMTHTWFGTGTFEIQGSLHIPDTWKIITLPIPVSLSGPWGSYNLTFKQKGPHIQYRRIAIFSFTNHIAKSETKNLRKLLTTIAQADNIQLMFFRK